MKAALKFISLFLLCGIFAAFGALWLATGGLEDLRREHAIRSLIGSAASRQQVAQRLPIHFTECSVGASDRWGLEQFLGREPATALVGLRDRVSRYPGVWFHTTMWTQTWLFFDEEGKLRDYYTCAQ